MGCYERTRAEPDRGSWPGDPRSEDGGECGALLGLSRRQFQRLRRLIGTEGAAAIRHRARGRVSNNRVYRGVRDYAVALVRERYADFGPTLAAEKLTEGIWLSRRQRRTSAAARGSGRARATSRDIAAQCPDGQWIDGSDHRWFEERGPAGTLLVFVDDVTSRLMQLRFVQSESTFSYFEALDLYLAAHGRPVAFYSDKHTVFRVAKQDAKSGHGMTQFGRALNELNVEILCANSSHAKGRVKRANRTLQGRLVKELRLAEISDMAAANAFLPGFTDRYNARFAKAPRRPDDLHRAMNIEPDRLGDVLCLRDQRYVGAQLSLSYERKRIILEENDVTRGLVGKYVDTYEFPLSGHCCAMPCRARNGRLDVRWKGLALPYSVFDKDQRVTHAAISENKHLGTILEFIKAEQEKAAPKARPAGKQRSRYTPTGRRNDGWNSAAAKIAKAKAAGQSSDP